MKAALIAFFSALLSMGIIDIVWLSTMAARWYAPRIGHLMAPSFLLAPGVIFYVIYAAGLTVLVIVPALRAHTSLGMVFLYGTVLGLVAYGTYDLTNHATLKQWSVAVTVVDMVWGILITGGVAVIATMVTRAIAS